MLSKIIKSGATDCSEGEGQVAPTLFELEVRPDL